MSVNPNHKIIMPTFQKCDSSVKAMAKEILSKYESHRPILDVGVTFDFLFAFCDRDEDTNEPLNDALTHNGIRALGIAKIVNLKDRVKGLADAEILLDGDHWAEIKDGDRAALLDHELHHISLKIVKGVIQHDPAGRCKLKMRKHDVEIGWFKTIAERHGKHSIEQQQAAQIMEMAGQYFWPALTAATTTTVVKRK